MSQEWAGIEYAQLGDANGDGYKDVILGAASDRLHYNDGNGQFASSNVDFSGDLLTGPGTFTIADLDNNGWPDILFSGWSTATSPNSTKCSVYSLNPSF